MFPIAQTLQTSAVATGAEGERLGFLRQGLHHTDEIRGVNQ
ncbi:hypothetical protein CKA32_001639 [Geitlerinema sp. FC II]|nr:hypothetical protein CKA32_001639 [Geitlerinema sp. FC II]